MKNSLDDSWKGLSDEQYRKAYRDVKLRVIEQIKKAENEEHRTTITRSECKVTGYPRLNWEIDYCLDNEGFSHGRILTVEEDDGLGNLTVTEIRY